jgi:hypothetical protein
MKKIKLVTILLLLVSGIYGQAIRVYPQSVYTVEKDGETINKTTTIRVMWDKDDASNLDKISGFSYPDGYIVATTFPKYVDQTKDGKYIYQFLAKDEGDNEITCYILKNSKTMITFGMMYKDLIIGVSINLLNYFYEK